MEGVYPLTSDRGSWIFGFASALLLCNLTTIFMPMYLSWTDVLVTAFQYRALLFTLTLVLLSVLLIIVFVGLSAEWLRAWSSPTDQLLRPYYHGHTCTCARDEFEGMSSSIVSDIEPHLCACTTTYCLGTQTSYSYN
jgi:membrane protein implicated in regulation of membrane protease activity